MSENENGNKSQNKSTHSGHRQRFMNALLEGRTGKLYPHQLFECVLSFAYRVKDTNPLAHELVNRFGSVEAIYNASETELMKVSGIGKTSADLIQSLGKTIKYLKNVQNDYAPFSPKNYEEFVSFCKDFDVGDELGIYACFFNGFMCLCDVFVVDVTLGKEELMSEFAAEMQKMTRVGVRSIIFVCVCPQNNTDYNRLAIVSAALYSQSQEFSYRDCLFYTVRANVVHQPFEYERQAGRYTESAQWFMEDSPITEKRFLSSTLGIRLKILCLEGTCARISGVRPVSELDRYVLSDKSRDKVIFAKSDERNITYKW